MTLGIWDKNWGFHTSSPSFVSYFLGQSWFPPTASPSSFGLWRALGICRFCDVATPGGLLSKEALDDKYGTILPWFPYCQIYDLYHNYFLKHKSDTNLTGFENLYKDTVKVKGAIWEKNVGIRLCHFKRHGVKTAQPVTKRDVGGKYGKYGLYSE